MNIIEAGFASVSEGEMEAVKLIANEGLRAEICSCSRGVKNDIEAVIESGADSVHIVIPTSDLHLQYKLKKTKEDVLKITQDCVQYAKDHGLKVELSAEDATRSDIDFVKKVFATGIAIGADRICPCDTVGVLTVEKAYQLFSEIKEACPNVPISVHCHNDFGMAVANSIAALKAGASEVHATINGLGERAGNASLEEIVVALKALYNLDTSINTKLLYGTSRLVAQLTGISVQPNKAIVGENAFAHEAGIHTHGVMANASTYEPIPPELVGGTRRIVAGKHAGKHGVKAMLEEMGLHPTEDQLNEIFLRIKNLGDKGKKVMDADVLAIAEAVMCLNKTRPIQLEELTVVGGNTVTPSASIKLKLNNKEVTGAAFGVGPVDAAINAVKKAVRDVEPINLEQYYVKAISGGTDAVVEVTVHMRKGDRKATAVGVREDIVMASVEAVLSGMNVLMADYNKSGNSSGVRENAS